MPISSLITKPVSPISSRIITHYNGRHACRSLLIEGRQQDMGGHGKAAWHSAIKGRKSASDQPSAEASMRGSAKWLSALPGRGQERA
jgi:hypothetical protein